MKMKKKTSVDFEDVEEFGLHNGPFTERPFSRSAGKTRGTLLSTMNIYIR